MAEEEKKENDEVVDSVEKQKDLEELRQMTSTGPGCNSQQLTEDAAVHSILAQWEGYKNFKRVKAFQALQGERVYQESLHKKTGQDPISVPGELALLKVYLDKAFIAYADTFGDPGEKPTMDVIRKVTAIGLRALENYGCPLRDIEGSLATRPPEHWDGYGIADVLTGLSADVSSDTELENCAYPDLRKNAECQACNIGGCEFDRRPDVQEPTTPSTEDISEADVSPVKEINEVD